MISGTSRVKLCDTTKFIDIADRSVLLQWEDAEDVFECEPDEPLDTAFASLPFIPDINCNFDYTLVMTNEPANYSCSPEFVDFVPEVEVQLKFNGVLIGVRKTSGPFAKLTEESYENVEDAAAGCRDEGYELCLDRNDVPKDSTGGFTTQEGGFWNGVWVTVPHVCLNIGAGVCCEKSVWVLADDLVNLDPASVTFFDQYQELIQSRYSPSTLSYDEFDVMQRIEMMRGEYESDKFYAFAVDHIADTHSDSFLIRTEWQYVALESGTTTEDCIEALDTNWKLVPTAGMCTLAGNYLDVTTQWDGSVCQYNGKAICVEIINEYALTTPTTSVREGNAACQASFGAGWYAVNNADECEFVVPTEIDPVLPFGTTSFQGALRPSFCWSDSQVISYNTDMVIGNHNVGTYAQVCRRQRTGKSFESIFLSVPQFFQTRVAQGTGVLVYSQGYENAYHFFMERQESQVSNVVIESIVNGVLWTITIEEWNRNVLIIRTLGFENTVTTDITSALVRFGAENLNFEVVYRDAPKRLEHPAVLSYMNLNYAYSSGHCGDTATGKCPGFDMVTGMACSGHGRCNRQCQCQCDAAPKQVRTRLETIGEQSGTLFFDAEDIPFKGAGCEVTCPGYDGFDANSVCSGRGLCLSDGSCQCQVGYTGDACQFTCPGFDPLTMVDVGSTVICSDHGACETEFITESDYSEGGYDWLEDSREQNKELFLEVLSSRCNPPDLVTHAVQSTVAVENFAMVDTNLVVCAEPDLGVTDYYACQRLFFEAFDDVMGIPREWTDGTGQVRELARWRGAIEDSTKPSGCYMTVIEDTLVLNEGDSVHGYTGSKLRYVAGYYNNLGADTITGPFARICMRPPEGEFSFDEIDNTCKPIDDHPMKMLTQFYDRGDVEYIKQCEHHDDKLLCVTCGCQRNSRDGYWDGHVCDQCLRGYGLDSDGNECMKRCPTYDGIDLATSCNGFGVCEYGLGTDVMCHCGGQKRDGDHQYYPQVVGGYTPEVAQGVYRATRRDTDELGEGEVYMSIENGDFSTARSDIHVKSSGVDRMYFDSSIDWDQQVCDQCDDNHFGENCHWECGYCTNNGRCITRPSFDGEQQCQCPSGVLQQDEHCCPLGFRAFPYEYSGGTLRPGGPAITPLEPLAEGDDRQICYPCPGLWGNGVYEDGRRIATPEDAKDFWWTRPAAAQLRECNLQGKCVPRYNVINGPYAFTDMTTRKLLLDNNRELSLAGIASNPSLTACLTYDSETPYTPGDDPYLGGDCPKGWLCPIVLEERTSYCDAAGITCTEINGLFFANHEDNEFDPFKIPCPVGKYSDRTRVTSTFDPASISACTSCPSGYFQSSRGSSECTECAPGLFQAQPGASECSECPRGFFQDQYGQSSCNDCLDKGATFYTKSKGSTLEADCQQCDFIPGVQFSATVCESGSPTAGDCGSSVPTAGSCDPICYPGQRFDGICQDCTAGQYQSEQGQTTCKECPTGQYQDSSGQSSCKSCAAGYYLNEFGSSSNVCKACPSGYHNSLQGQGICTGCGKGKYGSGSAKTSESSGCTSCPAGKYNDDTATEDINGCKNCPAGRYSNLVGITAIEGCTACLSGKYSTQTGQTDNFCQDCPSGFFQANSGQSSCKQCATGKASDAGQSQCDLCPAGKYQNGIVCSNCAKGRYQNQAGKTSCKRCPGGYHQTGTGKSKCDLNANREVTFTTCRSHTDANLCPYSGVNPYKADRCGGNDINPGKNCRWEDKCKGCTNYVHKFAWRYAGGCKSCN